MMKFRILLSWVIILFFSETLFAAFGGGSGTANNPYLIYTKEHLLETSLPSCDDSKHYKLMEDIDYMGQECPLLFGGAFRGVFDGNHKRIKNVYMQDQEGLFSLIYGENAVVKHLTLENPVLILSNEFINYTGLLAMQIFEGAIIEDCHVVNGTVQASIQYSPENDIWGVSVGGLTYANYGIIRGCSFSGTVTGAKVGGLAVWNDIVGIIEDCHASVSLYTGYSGGGIVHDNRGLIRRCSSEGMITAIRSDWTFIGGLVGINDGDGGAYYGTTNPGDADSYYSPYDGGYYSRSGVIVDCYSSCMIESYGKAAGGLVGTSWGGIIANCYATGSVVGNSYLGGLAGTIQTMKSYPYRGIIENCFSTGDVFGHNRIGGLAGENGSCIIRNCYSLGSATGTEIVGGLVGCIYLYPYDGYGTAIIDRCYSVGKVTGSSETGGMLGRHWNGTHIVTNSFWDTQTSGKTYSAGGTGKTTAQLKNKSTFTMVSWDFDNVWYMGEMPVLRWELNPLQPQIDAAQNGDSVLVEPGDYAGRLYFGGKSITLACANPTDPEVVQATVLRGKAIGPVVTFSGKEDQTCLLDGFAITGGYNITGNGGGICGNDSPASVRHCVFYDNTVRAYPGGGIWGIAGQISDCIFKNNHANAGGGLARCNGEISNCLLVNNTGDGYGSSMHNCDGRIVNCTIINSPETSLPLLNMCDGLFENCIFQPYGGALLNVSTAEVRYSCWPGATGEGNLSRDPLFVNSSDGDYHLLPDSPCIDAGNPDSDYSKEPWPNGFRVNMGVYGNTPEATTGRDGLIPLGFEIVRKVRLGRTLFQYDLAVVVYNSNSYDMNDVKMELLDADAGMISVLDHKASFNGVIQSGEIVTCEDLFTVRVMREAPIPTGRLTWILTYYVQGSDEPIRCTVEMPTMAINPTAGDITGDGEVNLYDFAVLTSQWNGTPEVPSADIALPYNGHVGFEDLLYLAENWLQSASNEQACYY